MNFTLKSAIMGSLVWLSLGTCVVFGQLSDNDASKKFLADHCATSAGGTSAQYEEYAERLAKTFSKISAGEQNEIFEGGVNPSGGTGTGGTGTGGTGTGGTGTGGTGTGGTGTGGTGTGGTGTGDKGTGTGTGGEDEGSGSNESGGGWGSGGQGGGWWSSNYKTDELTKGLAFVGNYSNTASESVSFSKAIVTEVETAGNIGLSNQLIAEVVTGAMGQGFSPAGEPILRTSNEGPVEEKEIKVVDGKISFLKVNQEPRAEKGAGN